MILPAELQLCYAAPIGCIIQIFFFIFSFFLFWISLQNISKDRKKKNNITMKWENILQRNEYFKTEKYLQVYFQQGFIYPTSQLKLEFWQQNIKFYYSININSSDHNYPKWNFTSHLKLTSLGSLKDFRHWIKSILKRTGKCNRSKKMETSAEGRFPALTKKG